MTARRFEINRHRRVQEWERIYLTEAPEGFTIKRRSRGSTGRPRKLAVMETIYGLLKSELRIYRILRS